MALASLPMYDFPELQDAHDALWAAIAIRLTDVRDVPPRLTRDGTVREHWSSPSLLFSQTCGYPLVTALRGRVDVVATPRYAAPGCEGVRYASAIVVAAASPARGLEDLRGVRCAVNDRDSHSGMNVLRAMVAPHTAGGARFFGEVKITGAHVASIGAVREGEAEVCAIDAVTHALLARWRPAALEGTRVLAMSPHAPALPFVTVVGGPVDALRRALAGALADDATADARAALLLDGAEIAEAGDYAPIAHMAAEAAARGYPELA